MRYDSFTGRHLCVERAAMRLLVGHGPGEGMKDFIERITSRLVGGDIPTQGKIRDHLLSVQNRDEPGKLFAASVHLRLQFPSIENDGFSQDQKEEEVRIWQSEPKNQRVLDSISNLIVESWAESKHRSLVYISSDSEPLKMILYEQLKKLSNEYRSRSRLSYNMAIYLPFKSTNLTHLRNFEQIHKDSDLWPGILFDWLMLSSSQRIISFRGVQSYVMSTFSLSAAMFGAPIRFSNDSDHFVYSGKRVVFKNGAPVFIDNF